MVQFQFKEHSTRFGLKLKTMVKQIYEEYIQNEFIHKVKYIKEGTVPKHLSY